MKNRIVHLLCIPVAFLLIPIVCLVAWVEGTWYSPALALKDLIDYIKSGEPFGPFDGGTL